MSASQPQPAMGDRGERTRIVRDDDRPAPSLHASPHQLSHQRLSRGIKTSEWLVEQEQPGRPQQQTGQVGALPHSLRTDRRSRVAHARQTDDGQYRLGVSWRQSREPGHECQVLKQAQ